MEIIQDIIKNLDETNSQISSNFEITKSKNTLLEIKNKQNEISSEIKNEISSCLQLYE